MKERPILYSSPMVLAKLAGRKTQTRRALKVQPIDVLPMKGEAIGKEWVCLLHRDEKDISKNRGTVFRSRFGVPGDHLWGRETWSIAHLHHLEVGLKQAIKDVIAGLPDCSLVYRADAIGGWASSHLVDDRWRPSIFMPRWACRLLDEIVSVRVERLQDISEEDAIAEGLLPDHGPMGVRGWTWPGAETVYPTAREAYLAGWDWLNGKGAAAKNPWVWRIETKAVKP
jgi:hypothetical protein